MEKTIRFEVQVSDDTILIDGSPYENLGSRPLIALSRAIEEHLSTESQLLDGSFHRDVYWPQQVKLAVDMTLSRHHKMIATEHCQKRIEERSLPQNVYLAMLYGKPVIARFKRGQLTEMVTRMPNKFELNQDVCCVFSFCRGKSGTHYAKAVTVWCNDADDWHETLDRTKYVHSMGREG